MNKIDRLAAGLFQRRTDEPHCHPCDEAAPVCTAIDGVAVGKLAAEHGSPLFVFSERVLRRTIREARTAFESRYPDVRFAWSYKTNYLKAICSVFHQEGSIAEVVSDFEYEKARGLGVAGRDIIFNGPHKPLPALERAIDDGAKIQIDNWDELAALETLSRNRNATVEVAIRVHMDCGVRPVWSKFGFSADSREACQAIKRIRDSGQLRLVGLHAHLGTYIIDTQIYQAATLKLLELAAWAGRVCQCNIAYLNLGGGFASRSVMHRDAVLVPSMTEYAEAICSPILEQWPKGRPLPRLYLETGRALIDEAGFLITSIVALKQQSSGIPIADEAIVVDPHSNEPVPPAGAANYLVDAGIHLLYTAAWYRYHVMLGRPVRGPLVERTLYGCLCMNIDVLRHGAQLPEMNVGDHLVLHPVGAYNVSQSMQFIAYRPRVVMISESGDVEILREREDLQHVEAMERLPQRLRSITPRPS